METYIVRPGDTLASISRQTGVALPSLLKANPSIKNPNKIVGQKIQLPARAHSPPPTQEASASTAGARFHWVKMRFDGSHLFILSARNGNSIRKFPAISGLPAGSPKLRDLIVVHGRTDLKETIDYTRPKHQDVKDAGPIPEGIYTLELTSSMKYDKSGDAWGGGGWLLKEPGLRRRLDDFFGGRFGFFLHEDGGTRGTAGCIGLSNSGGIHAIQGLLISAYKDGQRHVTIKVQY